MAAGVATLRALGAAEYAQLEERSARLAQGLADAAREAGVAVQVNRVGSMLTVFFSGEPVYDAQSARKSDTKKFARYFHEMLANGVYLPPSQFEAAFVSVAHTAEDVAFTVEAARKAFAAVAKA
jgi:glutamate-1-semialdehyde 2,1-aminomutase